MIHIHGKMESVPYVELFNNTECSKVQANHPLIALHFYSQFIFISSLFRSIYFHLAFPLLCPFSFARLRVTLWLRVLFGLFYCFSQLYVHSLLPDSVFLSGFRRILDFFPVFLGFMSIFSCLVPCYSLASGEFWTFLLFFCALCPFSPARFRISFWLHVLFGLFSCFSRLYVHFLLPGSVLLSGFMFFLDFFTAFLCFMSIFSCPVPYFSLASGCFWTFLLFFSALCPFSPARFRISLWLHVLFELFYCFSVLYVHFLLLGSVFLSGFRRILDFFPAFSRLYVHFYLLGSVFPSGFRMFLDFFTVFSQLYVHFLPPGSVFPSGFRMFLDFFTAFLSFMSIFLIAFTPVSVFPSGFRRILDFFTAFLVLMSIFTCSVPYFPSGCRKILDFFPGFLGFISIWKSIEVSRLR